MQHATTLQRLREIGVHSFLIGDLASKLDHALTSTRKRRRDQTRGYPDTVLFNALAEEGRPVCRINAHHDDRYFFWFLHESYTQIEVIERLVGSRGFCIAHGSALLARIDEAASQLAFVYETITHHLTLLAATGKGRQSCIKIMSAGETADARCPACRSGEEAIRRFAFFFAGMLNDPDVVSRYANPGILCLPHLQIVVPEVGDTTFERLPRRHADALTAALEEASRTRRDPGDPPDASIRRLLRLAVGHDRGPGHYRPVAGPGRGVSAIGSAGRTGSTLWKRRVRRRRIADVCGSRLGQYSFWKRGPR